MLEASKLPDASQGTGHSKRHSQRLNGWETPADLSKFWVIVVLSNPIRYRRRYELYWDFIEMCHAAGVRTITVEQAFGNRQFMVTEPNNPYHLQIRTVEELWHKENMINLGVKHACAIAPGEVREVAWIDADCRPARPYRDWFDETWHQLQHNEFVQMWESMVDLDANYNPMGLPMPSFMSNYIKYGTPSPEQFKKIQDETKVLKVQQTQHHHHHHHHHHPDYPCDDLTLTHTDKVPYPSYPEYGSSKVFGRPGLAWAANIDAWNKVGGLIDFSILGAGDWYMAHGLIGAMHLVATPQIGTKRYTDKLLQWQELAERWIKRDVGYTPGIVYHDSHGDKVNREYGTRGRILRINQYDPDRDVKYDAQGLLQLETWEPRQIRIRDEIRAYFRRRNEDKMVLSNYK